VIAGLRVERWGKRGIGGFRGARWLQRTEGQRGQRVRGDKAVQEYKGQRGTGDFGISFHQKSRNSVKFRGI